MFGSDGPSWNGTRTGINIEYLFVRGGNKLHIKAAIQSKKGELSLFMMDIQL